MDGLDDLASAAGVAETPSNGMVAGIPHEDTCGPACVGRGSSLDELRLHADTYRDFVLDSLTSAQARVTEALAHYRGQREQAVARHAEELSGIDAHLAALEGALRSGTPSTATRVRPRKPRGVPPRPENGYLWERIVATLKDLPDHTATFAALAWHLGAPSSSVNAESRRRDDLFRVSGKRGALAVTLR